MADVAYRTAEVDGLTVFYREAGASGAPNLVLLHGFASASHMFRELIPLLADRFRIIAPDLPGFGKSDMPARGDFDYTFEHITEVIDRLTEVLGLDRFALYVFDYGAPVGFRIATRHPERITAIISQNGNAYEEGLSDSWNPVQAYWKEPSTPTREAIRTLVEPQTTIWQYTYAATGRVGQERSFLPAGRSRSLQTRYPRRRRPFRRHWSLRPGDPRRGDCHRHPRVPHRAGAGRRFGGSLNAGRSGIRYHDLVADPHGPSRRTFSAQASNVSKRVLRPSARSGCVKIPFAMSV
jgi:pimeloyl-ACP methyl ester carboxylesterase